MKDRFGFLCGVCIHFFFEVTRLPLSPPLFTQPKAVLIPEIALPGQFYD